MLGTIVWIEFLSIFLINIKNIQIRRNLQMFMSTITFNLVLLILLFFNPNNSELQFRHSFDSSLFSFSFGFDGFNLPLVVLLFFLEPILLLINNNPNPKGLGGKYIDLNIKIIKILIFLLFLSHDLFLFFLTFELLLIPLFFYILISGSKSHFFLVRYEASLRFYFYTLFGSLLMLFGIIFLFVLYGSTNNHLLQFSISYSPDKENSIIGYKSIIWLLFFISFMVKLPVFPFHSWLPLAHSDAPTIGSIILASILLKLASFGLIRYSLELWSYDLLNNIEDNTIYSYFLPFIYILAFLSILYSSFIPIRSLFDFKKIIAYSSIVHMNFSLFGLFSSSLLGFFGASFLIYSHAFISSAFFLLVGLLYLRFHSRFFPYIHGLFHTMPIFSSIFLLFTFANLSLPFSSSFLSEFFILSSSFSSNPLVSFLLILSLLVSASFIIFFTNRLLFGPKSSFVLSSLDLSQRELFALLPFLFFTFFFSFFPHSLLSLFSFVLLPLF